jgi:carbamoyltransferase
MIICGLKLTHDGAVALFNNKKLIFSVEIEKINNNKRYSNITDLSIIPVILKSFGYKLTDIDKWVIDGWDGIKNSQVHLLNYQCPININLAPYHEGNNKESNVFNNTYIGKFFIGDKQFEYTSYLHVLGHLISAYCTSPFANKLEPSIVMIWDGGMFPRLYYVEPKSKIVECYGPFLSIIGHFYATAGHHFGPFKRNNNYSETADDLSIAGKLMAYIGLGKANKEVIKIFQEAYDYHFTNNNLTVNRYRNEIGGWGTSVEPSMKYIHTYFQDVKQRLNKKNISDEDILTSMHDFVEQLLVNSLIEHVLQWKGHGSWNLCFAGGCALNIKWNSALRSSPIFKDIWVPPFPNDSGSAIGTAATYLFKEQGLTAVDWNVYLGPKIQKNTYIPAGWISESCDSLKLAKILYDTNKPIIILNGRAELGPRALGSRSIIASATMPQMKELLNKVKLREYYRPVSPICLASVAPQIFDPGTPDPYMLFDHYVREEWVERIPAIVHVDKTARLQTVSSSDAPVLESILKEYYKLSGIPVLCNTSANYNGSGFFPDVTSAMQWGKIDMIWSDGVLYKYKNS